MNDNVVKFRKKYTLEEEQVQTLLALLTQMRANRELMIDHITKPWLAVGKWREVFTESLAAGVAAALDWLIEDLKLTDKSTNPNMYNMYIALLDWYKDATPGYPFAFTMYNDNNSATQYIFLMLEDRKLALMGLYDEQKDIVTGIIQLLNNNGMCCLGFQEDVQPK